MSHEPDRVNRCRICGHRERKRVAMLKHVATAHTQKERYSALVEKTMANETEA